MPKWMLCVVGLWLCGGGAGLCGAAGAQSPRPLWMLTTTLPLPTPALADPQAVMISVSPEQVVITRGAKGMVVVQTRTGKILRENEREWPVSPPPANGMTSSAPGGTGNPFAVQAGANDAQDGISVERIDTDDDGAGHSRWPKYLVGVNAFGRRRWQFPAKLQYRDDSGSGDASSMIDHFVNVPGTGVCIVQDEAYTLYGVRMRDGKLLWSLNRQAQARAVGAHNTPFFPSDLLPCRAGCFVVVHPVGTPCAPQSPLPTLLYVGARTGQARAALFSPDLWHIAIADNVLVAQVGPAAFRAYDIPSLLSAHRESRPAALQLPISPPAARLQRIVSAYPSMLRLGGRLLLLRTRTASVSAAPRLTPLPADLNAWLTRYAVRGLQWDALRVYARGEQGLSVWDRAGGSFVREHRLSAEEAALPLCTANGRLILGDAQGGIACVEGERTQTLWSLSLAGVDAMTPKTIGAKPITFLRPFAASEDYVYAWAEGGGTGAYRVLLIAMGTGQIVKQEQPQTGDDLNFAPFAFGSLPHAGQYWLNHAPVYWLAQTETSTGREFQSLLGLDMYWKVVWRRRVRGFQEADGRFVCAVSKPQTDVVDPENNTNGGGGIAGRRLIGLDAGGHERWRRDLDADVWPLGVWKNVVVVTHSSYLPDAARPRAARLRLSGIRPADGKVLWTIDLPTGLPSTLTRPRI